MDTDTTSRWKCFANPHDGSGVRSIDREEAVGLLEAGATVWIDIQSPHHADTVWLQQAFQFHPLALEDAHNDEVRSKNESYGAVLFTVFRTLHLDREEDELTAFNLNLFLTNHLLVTTHSNPLNCIQKNIERFEREGQGMEAGPSFLYYRLLDEVVDEYIEVTDQLEDRIDALESRIFEDMDRDIQLDIMTLKRLLAHFRHRILPERDTLGALIRGDFAQLDERTRMHLRDVQDHVLRCRDALDAFRDLLNGLRESHMNQLSHNMNLAMKQLSAVATLVLPLGFIAGVFGMNFSKMPMLEWEYGFWILMAAMGGLTLIIWLALKRLKFM